MPEPSTRNITAALENSRTARTMITPRNWPDSDQQHQIALDLGPLARTATPEHAAGHDRKTAETSPGTG